MKIVHVCLCGPVTDGWNYQDNIIPKYHRLAGHEVTIIASQLIWGENGEHDFDTKTDYRNENDVKMIRLSMLFGSPQSRLKVYAKLYQTLCSESPDIIFMHGCQLIDARTVVRYVKKHPKTVLYVDNHADYTNSAKGFLSRRILHEVIWRHFAHVLLPYARCFYGVLPVRVDFLINEYHLPPEKCELLVMGGDDELVEKADAPEGAQRIRETYGIAEDDFLVVTGGKIDAYKTQTLLLMEAVHKIENPKCKLLVFGSVAQELKEKVEALTDGKKVQYIGWVQSVDSYEYFAAADLVVFPGRHSVFWEQVAAQGVPMLCKDLEGTHHVDLGGNVRFLTEDSVSEIEGEIERLLNHSDEYRKMKEVALEKVRQVFSYRDIAARSIQR